MHLYDYEASKPLFDVRLIGATSFRCHYEVSFLTPHRADWEAGNIVYGDLFIPRNTKVPLLIISHGYGDESMAPCLTLARLLVREGIAAFVLYSPIHSRRLPATIQGRLLPADSRAWFEINQRAVMEIRRVVDWACTREDIDYNRIGVAGISLGGMTSAIAMAVDQRIRDGIFIMIGGNLEELSWGGKGGVDPTGHTCTREECHAVYSQYSEYKRKVTEKGLENAIPVKECFLIDPLTFADCLQGRPVLMINSRDDEIVSEKSTRALWETSGRPRLVWLSGTHAGAYAQSTTISAEIIDFLNSNRE